MSVCTPDLCDQFPDQVQVLQVQFNNYGGTSAFCGEVVTVKCFEDNSRIKELAAEAGEGRVIVVDGGASLRHALLGDMIAETAMKNGWSGMIIHGAVRDVDDMAGFAFGVKALGSIPLKTERRGLGDVNVPISLGGVLVEAGMYVYADNNGVIVSGQRLQD